MLTTNPKKLFSTSVNAIEEDKKNYPDLFASKRKTRKRKNNSNLSEEETGNTLQKN